MIAETHYKLGRPQRIECTRVIIRDVNGNPVLAAIELSPGHIWTTSCTEPDFQHTLEAMGLSSNFMTQVVQTDKFPTPPGKPLQLG